MGRPKQTRPPKPYPNHDRKFQILHELTPESIALKNLLAIPLLIPIVRSFPVPELLWHSAVLNPATYSLPWHVFFILLELRLIWSRRKKAVFKTTGSKVEPDLNFRVPRRLIQN